MSGMVCKRTASVLVWGDGGASQERDEVIIRNTGVALFPRERAVRALVPWDSNRSVP